MQSWRLAFSAGNVPLLNVTALLRRTTSHALRIVAVLGLITATTRAAVKQATYFDASPRTVVEGGAAPLALTSRFDAGRGFGWSTAPTAAFDLPDFSGVRSGPLLDGVSGNDFTLVLDLAPGRWTVQVFLDDGFRDAHTVAIQLNDRAVPHNPRVFGTESEPGQPPINRYRVAQVMTSSGGRTELQFRQPATHGARLLAVRALPMDWAENETTRWFRRQIDDAGNHPFRASLEILRSQLAQYGERPDAAACGAYWKAQVDLLAEAETFHRIAGWDEVSRQTRSSMFTRYKLAISLLDPLVDHPDGDAFPLRDRARWLRMRLLYWIWLEQHLPADESAYTADLAVLRKKYPLDPLMAMYAGEKIAPVGDTGFAPKANAPAWSAAQYEALQRLRDVAHYWIDERQIPNGEFGGKTDDDVELLRWWPVLMFSGDRKAREGFRRLADGVWFSPRMALGYSKVARDVEHSSEFVSDTVPMMALMSGDAEWIARLEWSHRHMRDLWTGRNPQGDRFFKSAWLGATEIISDPPRNRDVSMNARAAKAVRYHAWLTRDSAAKDLLHEWSLAWAKAAARTDKGKPRGLFPASLRWPDGSVNGDEPGWHQAAMFWDYYDWTGDGRLYDQLLFSWLETRDARLLEPLRETLAFLDRQATATKGGTHAPGSPAWAAARLMQSAEFWNVVTQWRLETDDARFDAFLIRHGPPYLRFRLTREMAGLAETVERNVLDVLRFNRPMRTSEVLFTDRVFVSRRDANADGIDLLAAMLTGCHSAQGASPYFHVAWDEAPATFTALVTSVDSDHFNAEVFLHQAEPGRVVARFLRLSPGEYRLTATTKIGEVTNRRAVLSARDRSVGLDLPGDAVVTVKIVRVGKATVR